jgi:hypothetical protein
MRSSLPRWVLVLAAFAVALVAVRSASADDAKASQARSTLLTDSGSYIPPKAKPQPTPVVRPQSAHGKSTANAKPKAHPHAKAHPKAHPHAQAHAKPKPHAKPHANPNARAKTKAPKPAAKGSRKL